MIAWELLIRLFSLKRSSMRGWHLKRLLAVVVQVPIFLGLLVINRLALLLLSLIHI